MKISIITCTYNRQTKLIRNIKSVLDQNFSDLEHIIIDDGSTDNSLEEIKKLNINYIKIISLKENLGQPAALFNSNIFSDEDLHLLIKL